MKHLTKVLIFVFLCSLYSCQEEDSLKLPSPEIKVETRDYVIITEAVKPLYCVWQVTSVVPRRENAVCKYSPGDKICYKCNEDGCPPGIIALSKNFSDGCNTYGEWLDQGCEEREDGYCAGKYQ